MTMLRYEVVDVFTDRPFAGNPLAVVHGLGESAPPRHAGARSDSPEPRVAELGRDQMQAIAREFNLSETIFVLPPTTPAATYRVRIFTPTDEIPFAGHPSVGAAVTLLRAGRIPAGTVVQECGAGLLPIVVEEVGVAVLTGGTPTVGPELDPAPLLAAVGLRGADLAGPPPRVAGCGLDFPYLSVRPDAVARAACDPAATRAAGVNGVDVFAWDADSRSAHARVFVPNLGVHEDPATGSAALGLGVWLVAVGLLPATGTSTYRVRQGAEIHRPSTLDCTVVAAAGTTVSVTVGGHVVPVARGEIALPPFIG